MKALADNEGVILITTVWVLAILSILAMGIGFRVLMEARLSKYTMDRLKALYLAEAGIVKCRYMLSNDNNDYDSLYEDGITLAGDEDFNGLFTGIKIAGDDDGHADVSYTNGSLKDYPGMMDEERKININKASQETLKNLLQIISDEKGVFLGQSTADELAGSIVFWRGAAPGAEDGYYQALASSYPCKHGNFTTLEELLLVKGMTLPVFNLIKDYVTVYGPDGNGINVNTAPQEVLMALGMPESLAEKILIYRNGVDGQAGTKDDQVFASPGEIEADLKDYFPQGLAQDEASSLEDLNSNQQLVTSSNFFRIESTGTIHGSGVQRKIAVIVQRDPGQKGADKLIAYQES